MQFWCSDPRAAAREIRKLWPQRVQTVLAIADELLEGTFTFRDHWEMERCEAPVCFGPDVNAIRWDHIPFGDPEWLYALNRHTGFLNLAKAWLYTGDDRYVSHLAKLWESWIDRVPLCPETENNVWRSLEAGLRCEFWLRSLFLTADSPFMTEDLKQKIRDCLLVHGDYLVKKSGDFQKFSNWGVLQDHGLFLLGLYFDRQDWVDLALTRLDRELHCQVLADGVHWEHSPMYHCEVLHCAIDTLLIARQNQIPLPARFRENVQKMSHAVLGMVSPDGVLLLQGDTDAIDAGNELALGALLFADGQMKALAGDIPYPENLWDLGLDAFRLKDIPSAPLPLSLCQEDSGNYLLRSEDSRDTPYLHFFCGSIGGGHGHADLLHLDAGVGSEPVLMDSGRYTYTDTPIRMELKSPRAHNTTTVDHRDFTTGVDTWTWNPIAVPFKGDCRFADCADFLCGHHTGYTDRGVAVTREIVWLRDLSTAVIFDQFHARPGDSHSYQQYFHFGKGDTELTGNRLSWKGTRARAELICLGDVSCTLGTAPCSRQYNELDSCPVLTVEQTRTGFADFVTVLDLAAAAPLAVRSLPVSCAAGSMEGFPGVHALELTRGQESVLVLLRSGEVTPPHALLFAGGREGFGRAVVFDRHHPDGLTLAH